MTNTQMFRCMECQEDIVVSNPDIIEAFESCASINCDDHKGVNLKSVNEKVVLQ